MPPRRKPKRVGLTRMHAAIDALSPLGFSNSLIRSTVNSLLKVYDGDSGWVFIEEASYKLVIETILEDQDKTCLVKKDESTDNEGRAVDIAEPSAAGASNEIVGVEFSCTKLEKTEQVNETEANDYILPGEGERLSWKDISCLNHDSEHKQIEVVLHRPRRKPCYGWIDSDDGEDEVFLETEVSLRRQMSRRVGVPGGRKERKSRWDVKPEDLEMWRVTGQ